LEDFKKVNKVLIAFDGSNPSARSLKSFVHLSPYGKDLEIELVFVNNTSKKKNEPTNSVLDYAESYLQEHGFKSIKKITLEGTNPGDEILEYHKEIKPGLIVLGAHSVSAMKRLVFGSTTHDLITKTNSPLFLSP
jgi:nucleotide-binding universal stress UspA family protein